MKSHLPYLSELLSTEGNKRINFRLYKAESPLFVIIIQPRYGTAIKTFVSLARKKINIGSSFTWEKCIAEIDEIRRALIRVEAKHVASYGNEGMLINESHTYTSSDTTTKSIRWKIS